MTGKPDRNRGTSETPKRSKRVDASTSYPKNTTDLIGRIALKSQIKAQIQAATEAGNRDEAYNQSLRLLVEFGTKDKLNKALDQAKARGDEMGIHILTQALVAQSS